MSTRTNYQRINLTKEDTDFYAGNYKIWKQKIKDLNKRDIP